MSTSFISGTPIGFPQKESVSVLYRRFFEWTQAKTVIRFAAQGPVVLWLNGQRIIYRNLKSYDFHRYYDEMEIQSSLHTGVNLLALEAVGPFVLEIESEGNILCSSDTAFRCLPNPARCVPTVGHSVTLGREEWFEAEKEPDWTVPAFDDSLWQNAQSMENEINWSGFTRYKPDPLTAVPVYGKQIMGELAAIPDSGQKITLSPQFTDAGTPSTGSEAAVYLSVLSCTQPENVTIHATNGFKISIDGTMVCFGEEIPLEAGEHLLCISSFGCCEISIVGNGIHLSAEALCNQPADFVSLAFCGAEVAYPWHESCGDVSARFPQLNTIHHTQSVEQLGAEYRFYPVADLRKSSLFDVKLQQYAMYKGAVCFPQLFPEKMPPVLSEPSPVRNAVSLLDSRGVCEITPTPEGDCCIILDLGKEYCGQIFLDIEAESGQTLDIQCFEVLDGNGIYLMENHNGLRYITRKGRQQFFSLSRYGCRYLMLTCRCSQPVRIYDFHLIHTVYPVSHKGSFRCSDEKLNQIFNMCVDTASLCMLDTYVDCPGHEQNFWVGDADITAKNNLLNFGGYTFNQHCISFVGQSLSPEFVRRYYPNDERYLKGEFLSIGAFDAYPEGGLPMWSFLWVQQIWEHYLYSGSREDLAENYQYLTANLKNAEKMINSRGLFDMQGAWNLIEWGNNDLSPCGEVTANNVFLVNSFRIAAMASEVLGFSQKAESYRKKANTLLRNINLLCWDEERQGYVDTVRDTYSYARYTEFCEQKHLEVLPLRQYLQCSRISEQSNTLALLYDCVPEERKQRVLEIARRPVEGFYRFGSPSARTPGDPKPGEVRDGIVMVGSPFFLYFTLGALFASGRTQDALRIIRRDWGYMLDKGTNTCWETFEMSEKKYTRSICHAWSAAPSIYLLEQVLGIHPVSAGYRKFRIEPHLEDLDWATGSVAVPDGIIWVSVRKSSDTEKYMIEYSAPDGYICENDIVS